MMDGYELEAFYPRIAGHSDIKDFILKLVLVRWCAFNLTYPFTSD
jgi:hypothetical protein